jgi:hypothetical protein
MQARGITASELANITGISNASLSQYMAGKNVPRKEKLEILADALLVAPEVLLYGDHKASVSQGGTTASSDQPEAVASVKLENNISVTAAAKLMGVSPQFIRVGLQKKTLPFGYAVKFEKSYRYFISAQKFTFHTGIEIPRREVVSDG